MKKTIFICLISLMTVFAVYSQTGIIREFTGEVELKPSGSSVFIPARAGVEVARDTIVSTGIKSTAVIEIGSSSIVVRPLTRLSLSEIQSSSGSENLNISLQSGRIRVDVKPPAGTRVNATVQSPTATASVRGTEFEMDAQNISVYDGKVAWVGKNNLGVVVTSSTKNKLNIHGIPQYPVDLIDSGLMPSKPSGAGDSGESAGASGGEIINSHNYIPLDVDFGDFYHR